MRFRLQDFGGRGALKGAIMHLKACAVAARVLQPSTWQHLDMSTLFAAQIDQTS